MEVNTPESKYLSQPNAVPRANTCKNNAEESIKHYIQSHRIRPQQKLPPIRALSKHLDLSRDSTWRALQAMQENGWVSSLPNKRYVVAESVYTEILNSLKIRTLFSGDKFIQFAGFRRLADYLRKMCRYDNLELDISLVPGGKLINESIWEDCDVLLVDSDSSGQLLDQFKEFPVPVIGLDAVYSERYHTNIVTDHAAGGSMVAEYMIEQGAKEVCIPYFHATEANPRVNSRINGFMQTWLESGRGRGSLKKISIPWSRNNFQLSLDVKEYLLSKKPLHNYFVTDGRLAVSFLDVCDYLSLSIPKEVKIVGYDGTRIGESTTPTMTTIQQDMEKMALEAITIIKEIPTLDASEWTSRIIRLKPNLVVRGSA